MWANTEAIKTKTIDIKLQTAKYSTEFIFSEKKRVEFLNSSKKKDIEVSCPTKDSYKHNRTINIKSVSNGSGII